ncbi:MAG TPA: heme lyase CcmF/NrfE family subunit [Solirubrobacterales bacterium]|jgi:cytochrome c-type biogenesis protein CcmF|nr:heme lyase CcmF/NrfE family subunit [Solirubrobacterales bacterium]
MIELGQAALAASLLTAIFAAGAAIYGAISGDRRWVDSSRRAVYAMAALTTTSVVVLEAAFLRDDFSFSVVASHSSTTTPTIYKLTAMWSSQEGSLLLWAWVLSLAASAVLYLTRRRHRELVPWATAVLAGLGTFFIALMLFKAHPFHQLSPAPAEGQGLTPLLRNWAMVIHPPMLYTGYVMLSVPFAFAIAALIIRKLDASWLRTTRRFALAAWTFLATGLLLGAFWSYNELGWGGYWAWDPVENAALMPWLITTAYLHSIMVQERRGMLKVWNVSLICGAFVLALLGTFLVRSGILESIHAFGASTVGTPLLVLIGLVAIGSTLLIASRVDDLRPERRIDSLLSRESIFLVNNLLLVGMTLIILWGTLFPIISDVVGEERNFAEPLFNQLTRPLAVLLVLFTGVGPLIAWGKLSGTALRRMFLWPAAAAAAAALVLRLVTDAADNPWALVLFAFAAFTLVALGQELWRAGASRRSLTGESFARAFPRAVSRNRRRYGGYVAHAGLVVLLVGVAASSSFQTNRDLRLNVGESAQVGDYTVTYESFSADPETERIAFNAVLDVDKGGEDYALLAPARNYYPTMDPSVGPLGRYFEGEATSEIGLKSGAGSDFWTAFQPDLSTLQPEIERGNTLLADTGAAAQGIAILALTEEYAKSPPPATFRVIVNPLVAWVWIGALVALAGAAFAIWPTAEARRRVRAAYEAKLGRELKRA